MHTIDGDSAFVENRDYLNVYFIKVDASGHSEIVRTNPQDRVDQLFDEVEQCVYDAVREAKRRYRCAYAVFWGWQGDGGLCVIYDDEERTAQRTALGSAIAIVDQKLSSLRSHLHELGVQGMLHVRIAIHKGSFRYKGLDRLTCPPEISPLEM